MMMSPQNTSQTLYVMNFLFSSTFFRRRSWAVFSEDLYFCLSLNLPQKFEGGEEGGAGDEVWGALEDILRLWGDVGGVLGLEEHA